MCEKAVQRAVHVNHVDGRIARFSALLGVFAVSAMVQHDECIGWLVVLECGVGIGRVSVSSSG